MHDCGHILAFAVSSSWAIDLLADDGVSEAWAISCSISGVQWRDGLNV